MEAYIYNELKKLYPDNNIVGLSTNYRSFYQQIYKVAEEKNMKIQEYLNTMGFNYNVLKSGVDLYAAKKLVNEFGVTYVDIAGWIGVTRAHISKKIQDGVNDGNWVVPLLRSSEIDIVEDMIKDELYSYSRNGISIIIKNNSRDCVVIIIDEKIRVLFDIPIELDKILKEKNYHYYSEEEFILLRNIRCIEVMGKTMVQANSNDRKKLNRLANKKGISMEHYVGKFGYQGIVDNKVSSDEEITGILQKYIVEDKNVYFPCASEDYRRILNRASRNNMEINDYINFFGFNRIDSRLDENYINKVDEIKTNLHSIANYKKEVCIPSESNLYNKLYSFCMRRDMSIDELVEELGFIRVYKNHQSDIDDKASLLNEIKIIQGDLDVEITERKKVNRNKELVKLLKILYDYKCQLCGENANIPIIEMDDNKNYVEVHHIKPISEAVKTNVHYEYDSFDTYKNTVVVCPFHHMYLHHHNGGFHKIIKFDGKLYFESNKGDRLKIINNLHLDVE